MIKLFITDLDGTLLGMNHSLKQKDITAVQSLDEKGIDFGVASGRMDHEILEVLKKVEVGAHRVSQNGAFLYDRDDQHIHSQTFEGPLAKRILDVIEEEPLIKTVSTADSTYTAKHSKWIDLISEQLFHDIIVEPSLRDHVGTKIHASKISLNGTEHEITEAYERIHSSLQGDVDIFISHESCVDIMPKAINKGTGIQALLDTLDVNPEEIVCIGDSFNDLSMFELTPHSYAMSGAHPKVKEKANHVVDHVYEAIEDIEKKMKDECSTF
ncbi:HAD family hydrolase [Pontibacillus sp. HMF3514]|uniref:HAD family hydrolase n=1 Tax=Pontibacillus sp. HMF3514 TaxID=2692425 RepID=UPI00131FE724|nr:HAD family hydrolase [Pontibacillus sp. HMF3514]QHE53245.1 Cof-type HAD-IIB family hydrolase [Pontibacillus sp. HMF3514]